MGQQTESIDRTVREVYPVKLEWLPQALLDFNEIVDFIAAENPVAAVD